MAVRRGIGERIKVDGLPKFLNFWGVRVVSCVTQWMTMYGRVRPWMTMYDLVKPWMTMYDLVRPWMTMYDHLLNMWLSGKI